VIVKSESLLTSNDDAVGQPQQILAWVVCIASMVANMVVCAFTAVVSHDCRRGGLYQFSVVFLLINLSKSHFFFINEIGRSFASLKKSHVHLDIICSVHKF
jgi:bacteriorhodopsin